MLRCPLDLPLLARVDGLERTAEPGLGARLHLDEHNRRTIQSDQIDLTRRTAVVACNDRVALPAQELLRSALALRTEQLPFVGHGGDASPPAAL